MRARVGTEGASRGGVAGGHERDGGGTHEVVHADEAVRAHGELLGLRAVAQEPGERLGEADFWGVLWEAA